MKNLILVGTLLVIVISLYWVPTLYTRPDDACFDVPKPGPCLSMKAHHIALSLGIEEALNYATDVIAPYSRSVLHMAMHMIGHAAYMETGDRAEAMSFLPKNALSERKLLTYEGYQHGVLQSYFSAKKESIDMQSLIEESCGEYYAAENTEGNPLWRARRQCFHAVGHGIMTAYENDINASIAVCKALPHAWMTDRCAYGAYMELSYLYSPDYYPNAPKHFVDGESMAALCSTAGDLEGVCSGFIGRSYLAKNPNDFKGAFEACNGIPSRHGDVCREDIAQSDITKAGDDFGKAKAFCAEAGPHEKKCLFATAKAVSFGLAGKSAQKRDFCAELDPSIQRECAEYVGHYVGY